MVFILRKDRPENSPEEFQKACKDYKDYLESIRSKIPEAAFDFAVADWHLRGDKSQDVHDSWLEELVIREPSSGDRHQFRKVEIFMRLLGPYHDGHIELTYTDVRNYSIEREEGIQGHGDWLYDEIRLSDEGRLLHEIEWWGGDWLIECVGFEYKWLPFEAADG